MNDESDQRDAALVAVARISRPRGNRGEVLADLLTASAERFAVLRTLTARMPSGNEFDVQLEKHWMHDGRLVLKFAGYDSISEAEQLRGAFLLIRASERIELDNRTFFVDDLVGCEVETTDGSFVGRVTAVSETAGSDLLQLVSDSGREHLIPFTDSICRDVDVEKKRITVDPPDGLLDL